MQHSKGFHFTGNLAWLAPVLSESICEIVICRQEAGVEPHALHIQVLQDRSTG